MEQEECIVQLYSKLWQTVSLGVRIQMIGDEIVLSRNAYMAYSGLDTQSVILLHSERHSVRCIAAQAVGQNKGFAQAQFAA